MRVGGLCLVLAIFAFPVLAKAAPDAAASVKLPLEEDAEITNPDWLKLPNGDDIAREYPPLAMVMGLDGSASVACKVEIDGRLDECHVVTETPLGAGFGGAAMRATAYFMMKPAMRDGKPIVGQVTIPLRFKGGWSAPAPEAPAPNASPAALALARRVVALSEFEDRTRRSWEPELKQQAAMLVAGGEAQASVAALDALRLGLEDTLKAAAETRAHYLAAEMSEDQLKATIAYLEGGAGKAWLASDDKASAAALDAFKARVGQAARAHLCAQAVCAGAGLKKAAANQP